MLSKNDGITRKNQTHRAWIMVVIMVMIAATIACTLNSPQGVSPGGPSGGIPITPLGITSAPPVADPITTVPPEVLSTPFAKAVGNWKAIDIDGSNLTMAITNLAGGGYSISYHDKGATNCGEDANKKLYPADGVGTGKTTTNKLVVELKVTCLKNPPSALGVYNIELSYLANKDTISDSWGVSWQRSN